MVARVDRAPDAGTVAGWLPPYPLDRADLETLEARDPVSRVATVDRRETDAGTFAGGLQIEVQGATVYLADLREDAWTVERYAGANLWWLRDERADRVDERG